jgi:hypothetical protein
VSMVSGSFGVPESKLAAAWSSTGVSASMVGPLSSKRLMKLRCL